MLGIDVCESTAAKSMLPHRKPPSQTWRTFLDNHARELSSIDFFTVSTVTFRVLYMFLVLRHERREVVRFNVTTNPSAQWTAQQMVEGFPFDTAPRYLLRDRDAIYGGRFGRRARSLGIEEVRITPRSPWQSSYLERLIGSIRRECLDHVIIFNEHYLKRMLGSSLAYYPRAGTHLALDKQCPEPRPVPQTHQGCAIAFPHFRGLHREYRRAACERRPQRSDLGRRATADGHRSRPGLCRTIGAHSVPKPSWQWFRVPGREDPSALRESRAPSNSWPPGAD